MSELISGKEALNNWYDDIDTEIQFLGNIKWYNISDSDVTLEDFKDSGNKFRLKTRTITINNIEVPAPFEPKEGDECWHIWTQSDKGYGWCYEEDKNNLQFGAWRTEDEIKQVVAALRKIFVINNQ
ncbi:MAG: hypothetical protein ABS863_00465 [Aerococcus urinaeequi]